MEEPRPDQKPEAVLAKPDATTAARTRPADAGAPGAGADDAATADDADAARRGARDADAATKEMAARGFGSHKGTEAD